MIKKLIKSLLVCLCLACLTSPNTFAQEAHNKVRNDITQMALKMGVDPYVVLSIAKLESNFDHYKKNASGAVGIFQLMPKTAKLLGVNPYLQDENIKGGILYYKQLYKKYGSVDLALAAYNAGPGNVKKYNGIPPFKETRAFVARVKKEYNNQKANPAVKPVVHKETVKEDKVTTEVVEKTVPSVPFDTVEQAEAI